MTKPPLLTDEVRAALAAQRPTEQAPRVPDGHVRYLVAVGESVSEGTAPPDVVAAILRAQAEAISPTKPTLRGPRNADSDA